MKPTSDTPPAELLSLASRTQQVEAELSKDLGSLPPEDASRLRALQNEIDLKDSQTAIQFGVGLQKNISDFSDNILEQVRTKDAGQVGGLLVDLMQNIREVDVDGLTGQKKGLLGRLFGSLVDQGQRFMQRYQKIGTQIENITDKLDQSRLQLIRDVVMLDSLFERNLGYFRELNLYIAAGEAKVLEAREKLLPEMERKAKESGDPLSLQQAADFQQLVGRFEKRVHDLKLTRMITLQTIPQIRIVQGNNQELVTKIQSSILNTIPLWKNQVVIAISLFRQKSASKLQKQVSDTTNDLLKKNAELLKQNSGDIARESERGIVDVDTLKKVNADLISTIEETLQIQREGREKRAVVERELVGIEQELKQKLLTLKK